MTGITVNLHSMEPTPAENSYGDGLNQVKSVCQKKNKNKRNSNKLNYKIISKNGKLL